MLLECEDFIKGLFVRQEQKDNNNKNNNLVPATGNKLDSSILDSAHNISRPGDCLQGTFEELDKICPYRVVCNI